MTPETVVDIFQRAQYVMVMMVIVLVAPGLVVGVLVSVFQAATQINEQTLSFLPRLMITLATMTLAGHWMLQQLIDMITELFFSIPQLIG